MKKYFFLTIAILLASNTFANTSANAKLLKLPSGYLNSNLVYELESVSKGCRLYYSVGNGSRYYVFEQTCEEIKAEIEKSESK